MEFFDHTVICSRKPHSTMEKLLAHRQIQTTPTVFKAYYYILCMAHLLFGSFGFGPFCPPPPPRQHIYSTNANITERNTHKTVCNKSDTCVCLLAVTIN